MGDAIWLIYLEIGEYVSYNFKSKNQPIRETSEKKEREKEVLPVCGLSIAWKMGDLIFDFIVKHNKLNDDKMRANKCDRRALLNSAINPQIESMFCMRKPEIDRNSNLFEWSLFV